MFFNFLRLVTVASFFILSACAIGVPKTVDEFKGLAEKSSFARADHFPIEHSSMKDVEGRLNEYMERCLHVEMGLTKCGAFNTCRSTVYATISARLEKEKSKLRLVVQRKEHNVQPAGMPEGGMFILVAEAETAADKKIQGSVYAPKFGYGDLLGSTKGWLTGENKTCPAF